MPSPFRRTARTLGRDSSLATRVLLASSVVLLGAWLAWFTLARVPVYESSSSARLEVLRATHPLDAPLAGRVVAVNFVLDQSVAEGDVLVELDATTERLQLAEAQAKAAGIEPQLDATKKQAAAESRALGSYQGQLGATLAEARGRLHEGEVQTRAAEDDEARVEKLVATGTLAEVELVRARAEVERRQAAEAALRATVDKLGAESTTGGEDRQTRVASLARDAARLDADLTAVNATIQSLEHDIELRTIRAPAAGKIGEIGNVRVGSVVQIGDHIATIVAGGDLRVVAEFEPARALGRVRPGQRARVRLDGFPWTEYGDLEATVTDVATELRDGHARIELVLVNASSSRIPLQHGLPGKVDVAVESATPAALVLRAAGQRLGT